MRSRFVRRKGVTGAIIMAALIASFLLGNLHTGHGQPFDSNKVTGWTYSDFVKNFAAHYKAPFASKLLASKQQFVAYGQQSMQRFHSIYTTHVVESNIKVNQDRNPWPKTSVGAAIDPTNGQNYVVMSNDYRQYSNHQYFHSSTDGGRTWTDDALANSMNPQESAPYSFQNDPGVAFDLAGHSFTSTLSGNVIDDFNANYGNFDTEIDLAQGYGTYMSNGLTAIDYLPCNGNPTVNAAFNCMGQLDRPFVTVDNNPGSSTKGSIYVYYTYFCTGTQLSGIGTPTPVGSENKISSGGGGGGGYTPISLGPCVDGNASIAPQTSAILESHSAGAGLPFSPPALVSGIQTQAEFSSMVIDKKGIPHIFFDDFSAFPTINLYESTLSGTAWSVMGAPVVNFQYNGLNNVNWGFLSTGTVAPGCTLYHDTAYCAFSASQVGSGPANGTPDVYLAKVELTPKAGEIPHITHVNNDSLHNLKDHFFPWASVTSKGTVYVGWYDNRHDPFNAKVEYFVGKSTDGGKTFPLQKAVSDTAFNPCVGYPNCGSFGDYYQLVTGPDDLTHATWADTRDGASMQLYTQTINW